MSGFPPLSTWQSTSGRHRCFLPALGQQPMSKCIAKQLLACLQTRHPCVCPQMLLLHAGMAWPYWDVRLWAHQLSCCMASPSSAACHPSMCSSRSSLLSLAKGMTCRYEHPRTDCVAVQLCHAHAASSIHRLLLLLQGAQAVGGTSLGLSMAHILLMTHPALTPAQNSMSHRPALAHGLPRSKAGTLQGTRGLHSSSYHLPVGS